MHTAPAARERGDPSRVRIEEVTEEEDPPAPPASGPAGPMTDPPSRAPVTQGGPRRRRPWSGALRACAEVRGSPQLDHILRRCRARAGDRGPQAQTQRHGRARGLGGRLQLPGPTDPHGCAGIQGHEPSLRRARPVDADERPIASPRQQGPIEVPEVVADPIGPVTDELLALPLERAPPSHLLALTRSGEPPREGAEPPDERRPDGDARGRKGKTFDAASGPTRRGRQLASTRRMATIVTSSSRAPSANSSAAPATASTVSLAPAPAWP